MAKKEIEAKQRKLDTLEFTLGYDIMGFLQEDDVFEIIVNPDTKIWIDTFSKGRVFSGKTIAPELSEQIILQVANLKDMVCSAKNGSILNVMEIHFMYRHGIYFFARRRGYAHR